MVKTKSVHYHLALYFKGAVNRNNVQYSNFYLGVEPKEEEKTKTKLLYSQHHHQQSNVVVLEHERV